jgi:hypothetical protein
VREVPIHGALRGLIAALLDHDDRHLIPGLLEAGRDKKRSVYVAKRAAWHLRRQMKITDPTVVASHSLRHAFIGACERASVPENVTKLIVGHSRGESITYGSPGASYSSSLPFEQLAQAVSRVTHGKALDGIVERLGAANCCPSSDRDTP